jgi:preprotein translocase subunit YajC
MTKAIRAMAAGREMATVTGATAKVTEMEAATVRVTVTRVLGIY